MASRWERVPLRCLLAGNVDYRGKTPPKSSTGIPVLSAANVRGGALDLAGLTYVSEATYEAWTTRGLPAPGDVLITTEAPVGEVAPFPQHGTWLITRRIIALRPDSSALDSRFLLYGLMGGEAPARLRAAARGTTAPRILKTDILDLEVAVPPLPEQKAIAHVLGTLDDKIELNRRTCETLEAMARAIFRSWFVDFDPVWAKREGRRPAGMDTATAALFPDDFEDSELGPIPRGWRVGPLSDVVEVTMGSSPPGETYNDVGDGVPFYQGIRDFGRRSPTPRVYCSAPIRAATAGDTLVSVRAPVGQTNMAAHTCCIGRGVAAIGHRAGLAHFAYQLVRSLSGRLAAYDAEGTVFGAIRRRDLEALLLVHPPEAAQRTYDVLASALGESVSTLEAQGRALAAVRDALLPKLMSGEVRVGDARVGCSEASGAP